jgi:hypothetical protein
MTRKIMSGRITVEVLYYDLRFRKCTKIISCRSNLSLRSVSSHRVIVVLWWFCLFRPKVLIICLIINETKYPNLKSASGPDF